MELHQVDSSVLAAAGYDADRHVLEARFCSGRIYHYFEVPESVFRKLLAAKSVGGYFNGSVKPRYRAELVYDPNRGR